MNEPAAAVRAIDYALRLTVADSQWQRLQTLCNRLSPGGLLHTDSGTFGNEDLAQGQCAITLYLAATDHERARQELQAAAARFGIAIELSGEPLPDRDWNAAWKAHYEPLRIGRRIRVEPAWLRQPDEAGVLPVVIEPGQAFGTGTHETTWLATVELERLLDAWPGLASTPPTMLDVGTGSAILAIAAVRLGLPRVMGTDYDPEAVDNARYNVALNGMQDNVELRVTDDPDTLAPQRFDLVVANIISGILLRLRDALVARTRPDGMLLISGVLLEERERFLAAFLGSELTLVRTAERGEWTAMVLRRVA